VPSLSLVEAHNEWRIEKDEKREKTIGGRVKVISLGKF